MKWIVHCGVVLTAMVCLVCGSVARANTSLILELPELYGTFTHGQEPITAVFDFGQPFVWDAQFFITITGTGTPGELANGEGFSANLAVSVYYIEGQQISYDDWVGPFSTYPRDRYVSNIVGHLDGFGDVDGEPAAGTAGESGQLLVVFDSNPGFEDFVVPSTIEITQVTMEVIDVEPEPPCTGCFCDGFVGLDDLDRVLVDWNKTAPPADPCADLNGDGFVGLDDLDIVLNNWNAGTPPDDAVACGACGEGLALNEELNEPGAVVPEPGSVGLLMLGCAGIAWRRWV